MINKEFLLANHAALVEELRAEGFARGRIEGLAAGGEAERSRILAVEAVAMPGCEALVKEMKADGKTTGPAAALRILAAYKLQNSAALDKINADAGALPKVPAAPSQSGDAAAQAAAAEEAKLPLEERTKKRWDRDAAIRAEFGDNYASYLAYEKNAAAGNVRVFGSRKTG